MAIDSAAKRSSIAGIHLYVVPGITPDASKGIEWRLSAGFSYAGTTISVAAAAFIELWDALAYSLGIKDALAYNIAVDDDLAYELEESDV